MPIPALEKVEESSCQRIVGKHHDDDVETLEAEGDSVEVVKGTEKSQEDETASYHHCVSVTIPPTGWR